MRPPVLNHSGIVEHIPNGRQMGKLMKLMTDTQVVKQSVKWEAVNLKGERVTAKRCVRHFCVSSTTTHVHLTKAHVRTYKVFRIEV